ncbi:MAG: nuclear transport factor 2 family protein [Salegentibacter sp.]
MKATETLLRKINEAFARNNREFILEHVTDDITWDAVGYQDIIRGKEEFERVLKEMDAPCEMDLQISNIVVQGTSAAVDGTILVKNELKKDKKYAFCDIYKLKGEKDPKICEMISYVINISKQRK